jgi:predicted CXXCH cytochrome family protein
MMRSTKTSALVAAALLLLAARPARAGIGTTGSLGGTDDSPCTLKSVDRTAASTRDCLTCHDGSLGSLHASLRSPDGTLSTHPVDVSYDDAVARNPRLHTRYELSRRLALPGGKVACVTCHDGTSAEPQHTALTMSRSQLCFSCHAI